jgi:hypothetical protein
MLVSGKVGQPVSRQPLGSIEMVIYRFTRKLIDKGFTAINSDMQSNTRFGDWFADYVKGPSFHVILFTSEKTLLPIIIPSSPKKGIIERFINQLQIFMRVLRVDEEILQEEIGKMGTFQITKTNNRHVLGTMNDFKIAMDYYSYDKNPESMLLLSAELAETPCGPIEMASPLSMVRKLFI